MSSTPPNKDASTGDSAGREPVTRKMVRERAVALAGVHGRPAQDVSKSDWERAKWELAGEPDSDPKEATPESGVIGVQEADHDQMQQAARMEQEGEES